MSALSAFGDHVRKQATSARAAPASDQPAAGDTDKSDQAAQAAVDSINQAIKKPGNLRALAQKLDSMDMRTLLTVVAKLDKGDAIEALAGQAEVPVPDRVGIAILTVRGDFDNTWRKLFPTMDKDDQAAILERTPDDIKQDMKPVPTKKKKDDDDDDGGGLASVGPDGVEMQAKISWKSPLVGSLGETEFTVHVGPGGKLKQLELDVTAVKQKIEKLGVLAPMLELEASLSLNATVDNKAVSVDPGATRVILGALQVQAKAEIVAKFKTIRFLKNVSFKLNVTAGTGGVTPGFAIEIPIPGS
jgi:hypothetical protein